jgi:hypothetical protein
MSHISVGRELLEQVIINLEGHQHSAYCQAFDAEDELVIARLKAILYNTPLTEAQSQIVSQRQVETQLREEAELILNKKHKCPLCHKVYTGSADSAGRLKQHIANKHKKENDITENFTKESQSSSPQ